MTTDEILELITLILLFILLGIGMIFCYKLDKKKNEIKSQKDKTITEYIKLKIEQIKQNNTSTEQDKKTWDSEH